MNDLVQIIHDQTDIFRRQRHPSVRCVVLDPNSIAWVHSKVQFVVIRAVGKNLVVTTEYGPLDDLKDDRLRRSMFHIVRLSRLIEERGANEVLPVLTAALPPES